MLKCSSLLPLISLLVTACPGAVPPPPRDPGRRGRSGAQTLAERAKRLPQMKAHFINVGQGDAVLLEFPCAAMLVDAGGEQAGEFDSNKVLAEYLGRFFARRADLKHRLALLAISHPHHAHVGGVTKVLLRRGSRVKIANVITNGREDGPGAWQQKALHKWAAAQKDVKLRKIIVEDIPQGYGLTGPIIDPIRCPRVDPKIRVLWGAVTKKPKDWDYRAMENMHNHSVVIRVDFGKVSFLLPGDLEEEGLSQLGHWSYPSRLLDVDVLKVPGHGSEESSNPGLLRIASPRMAVISVGPHNRYYGYSAFKSGLPRLSAVKLLLGYLTAKRLPQRAFQVATGPRKFKKHWIGKALYSTAWDGHVVIEAATNGWMHKGP
jgi:competence protein ComEC